MLEPSALGRSFGPYTVTVEAEPLRLLASVLGDPALAPPPTFMTRYGLWANTALLAELADLGAPLPRLLHGEQRYRFHTPVGPGDTLTAAPRIAALEQKSGRSGPFQLLTLETAWRTPVGAIAVEDTLVVVVRGDEPERSVSEQRAPNDTRRAAPDHRPAPPSSRSPDPPESSGADLPTITLGPLAPEDFARYAAASGDHNPLHTDPTFARAAGLEGVIAHGMLVMGVMSRVAAAVAGSAAVTALQARFLATTVPGELIRCGGRVLTLEERDGQMVAALELWATGADGGQKATGAATVTSATGASA